MRLGARVKTRDALVEYRSVRYWSRETNMAIPGGEKGNFFIRAAER
jgi:hypothetical protein